MRRVHLFEIEDQPWCPASIRDGITDYLQFTIAAAKPYAPIAPRLAGAIRSGMRTLFTAFHHFRPDDAREVRRDAARRRATIAVFEATHRSVLAILVPLLAPMIVLLVTPAVRPFRWSRLLWTYLVPVIPLVALFDGVVSCLRTYTPTELREMTTGIDGYRWDAGEDRTKGPVPVTYLIGTPM